VNIPLPHVSKARRGASDFVATVNETNRVFLLRGSSMRSWEGSMKCSRDLLRLSVVFSALIFSAGAACGQDPGMDAAMQANQQASRQ